jgi:23S rRNA pseudouridine2605 synthase
MIKNEKDGSTGGAKKKHGDYSKFIKKNTTLSRSRKTSGHISKRFAEDELKQKPGGMSKKHVSNSPKSANKPVKRTPKAADIEDSGLVRLNKYIANAGVCSRREADNLIQSGAVMVNSAVVTEVGTKVKMTDKVQIGDQTLKSEKPRYVLLNKPKGYITTTDDPDKRNTVMMLVEKACKERIYPVGRLDRNTTGVLLLTNDGEIAKKLTHPRNRVNKTYHVYLDKNLTKNDMRKIEEGIELEDGFIKVDGVAYVGTGADKKDIGIELHSGKNRIVRRIFETLGYQVVKLDRALFAGLTKKDLPRGKWRHLSPKEVSFLKML